MTFVRSFDNAVPPARFDSVPYETATIQESASAAGPWGTVATLNLATGPGVVPTGLDTNPAAPQVRDMTTALATLDPAWYRVIWADGVGGQAISDPIYSANDLESVVDNAATIRARTPNIQWDEMGYPAPASGQPDPLDPEIVDAVAEFESLTGIKAESVDTISTNSTYDRRTPLIRKAIRMLVMYNVSHGSQEILETVADFALLSGMNASSYSETRRNLGPQANVLHPWPALHKLLVHIINFDQAGQSGFEQPDISVKDTTPTPGEWADKTFLRSPYEAPLPPGVAWAQYGSG